jgi:hypothetical protein
MAKISKDLVAGNLHPRETLFGSGTIGALNSEVIVAADGASSVTVDLRGTFSLTLEIAGSIDGVNWVPIPVRAINQVAIAYVTTITGTAAGLWTGKCAPFRLVRARCTAFTSGAASVVLAADVAPFEDMMLGLVSSQAQTATGISGAAVTLTLPAPTAGLRHYLTGLVIGRFAAAALTASATPLVVTTTNLPGALAFTLPLDGALLGTMVTMREEYAVALAASAQATATTIVLPASPGVLWRVTATYYVGP